MDCFFPKSNTKTKPENEGYVIKKNFDIELHNLGTKICHCDEEIQKEHNISGRIIELFYSLNRRTTNLEDTNADVNKSLCRRIGQLEEIMIKTVKRIETIEKTITNQLEAKNNPQPKLSIEKIPPISFLSK